MEIISRDEADAKGKHRFYTGVLCIHGHDCERYVTSGGCVQCANRTKRPAKPKIRFVNQCWPDKALVSLLIPAPTREESQAAFRMIERYGWFDHCVTKLRESPELLNEFLPIDSKARNADNSALQRAMIERDRINAEIEKLQKASDAHAAREVAYLKSIGSNKV